MKSSEFINKIKSIGSRSGKKTLIAVCAVLVLGCTVVLNFVLQHNSAVNTDSTGLALDLSKNSVEETASTLDPNAVEDYFASITLQRKQARDEAMEVLQTVAASSTALEEAK